RIASTPRSESQQAHPHRVQDRFRAIACTQLVESPAEMVAHRLVADAEAASDLFVRKSARDLVQDIELPLRKIRRGRALWLRAGGRGKDAFDHLVRRYVLVRITEGAAVDRRGDHGPVRVGRQHQHPHVRCVLVQPLDRLDGAEPRHLKVHQHHVRPERERFLDGFGSIPRLCDYLDPRITPENPSEACAKQRVVVGDQDLDGRVHRDHRRLRAGTRTSTLVPPDSSVAELKVPPSITARSDMPTIPKPDSASGRRTPSSMTTMTASCLGLVSRKTPIFRALPCRTALAIDSCAMRSRLKEAQPLMRFGQRDVAWTDVTTSLAWRASSLSSTSTRLRRRPR